MAFGADVKYGFASTTLGTLGMAFCPSIIYGLLATTATTLETLSMAFGSNVKYGFASTTATTPGVLTMLFRL
jgi:hypothetical protein